MVRVDADRPDPFCAKAFQRMHEGRAIADRNERLGQLVSERSKPGADPGAEDDGRSHGVSLPLPRNAAGRSAQPRLSWPSPGASC